MRIGKIEVKRRVWIGLLFAVSVTGAWWLWTRSTPLGGAVAAQPKQPFVQLVASGAGTDDQVLRERAELLDPTPLFFPTKWNFGQSPLRESMRRQPGQVFGSIEAKFVFDDQNMKPYGTEPSAAPEKLSDMLVQGNEAPLAGMGQVDVERPALAERSGFVEVRGLINGEVIIEQSLKNILVPRSDYVPLEFLVVVGSAGVVGDLVLTSPSGWEEVDNFFRTYLVKSFRLGERLNPGRYRVLVGP